MTTLQISDEQKEKILNQLRERLAVFDLKPKSKRALDAECHFMCGAMAAINACYPDDDPTRISSAVPPEWIFAPLRGVSVLAETPKE